MLTTFVYVHNIRETPINYVAASMQTIESDLDRDSDSYRQNRAGMIELIDAVRALEARTVSASEKSAARFSKRGQILPRERLARLLDPGTPFLELLSLTGYCGLENPDPETSIPGSAIIAGIGYVGGTRVMIVVNDSGINAGAMQNYSGRKVMRAQEIALENKLPYIQLVESAGGNLRDSYRVERFIIGGGMFRNLARLSAAGLPVIAVVHGSSTAGGAYLPGLSDYVVMVRGRARAFLAGPPLLKAATGEIASEEELGGADMHASVSGLGDFVAENDAEAISIARDIVGGLDWNRGVASMQRSFEEPRLDPDELAGIVPLDYRKPVDMRQVIGRITDASEFSEFRPTYGSATVCGTGFIEGYATGFITNNGPLDPQGATKAAQFIQLCDQAGAPIVYLQNITGFIVGRASEEAGMIKHGAKLIQALSNTRVPQITIMCGASFGAGNYGMCGRAFVPRFAFSWPNAQTAVMGGEQAATTMAIVAEESAKRRGKQLDVEAVEQERQAIIETFERQMGAIHTSSLMLDDGVIDPRDTRRVLAIALSTCREGDSRQVRPVQYGVARL
jgi:geranyl-CoA carboxylase beta subunit